MGKELEGMATLFTVRINRLTMTDLLQSACQTAAGDAAFVSASAA